MSASIAAYGRLGRDPEQRTSKAGKTWASASIAVQAGDDNALWLGIVAFGKAADVLLRHAKGDPISVSGRLQLDRWTDSDGKEHEKLKVVADAIISARSVRPAGNKKRAKDANASAQSPGVADFDDEVPF